MRRRYIAVEVNCEQNIDWRDILDAVYNSLLRLFGEYGASLAELALIDYDPKVNHAIFRCTRKALDMVKASIVAVREIYRNEAAIQILHVSGTLKALKKRLARY